MIRYTCERCKEKLESPDTLAGLQDQCPTCGKAVTVPRTSSPRTAKPFWFGAISGFVSAAILAVGIGVAISPAAQSPEPKTTESKPTVSGKTSVSREPVEEIEKLTLDDILAFGKAHGMEMPKPFMGREPDYCGWDLENGVYFRCDWRPKEGNRITYIFVGNMHKDHGPKGQSPVLAVWKELCPNMYQRFEAQFRKTKIFVGPVLWIGKSPYAYGTAANNKAFVEYIGPQSDIPRRKVLMAVTAKVRINWHHCLLTSQKKLQEKMNAATSEAERRKAFARAMSFLELVFGNVYTNDFYSLESLSKRQVLAKAMTPDNIPHHLPQTTRTELHKTASAIQAIAQLTRFIIEGEQALPYRPYDVMLIELARGNPETSAWGPYKRVDGLGGTQHLPTELRKAIEKITFGSLAVVMSGRGIIKQK